MKVYITQGHEKGIGLEVLFKTCLMLGSDELSHLKLLAFPQSVENTLSLLNLPYKITDESLTICSSTISVEWMNEIGFSESFTTLELGMRLAESGGVLYTLPTSKDQFPGFPGHTEYFRHFYKKSDLGMFFSSPDLQVLLLSDHVPISKLSEVMTEEAIHGRLDTAIKTLQSWNWPIKKILISGFNPHSGEGGLIGTEDQRITKAMHRLTPQYKLDMKGPIPGDTMVFEQGSADDLLVYLFHDQGLGVFKGLQGFVGSNITLGLPYPRFSPDHGTSFPLYGKNLADYRGCAFSLRQSIMMLKRIANGKDSSYQGKGSQSKKH